MSESPHVIGKVLFQIRLPDRDRAEPYFIRISRFCNDELPGLLNRLLDDAGCPPGTHIRIDRLVVNAGILSEKDFEAGLLHHLEQELRRSLRLTLQLTPTRPPSKQAPALEILEFFFQHGYYPWWASRDILPDLSPEALWQQTWREHRQETVQLLKKILDQPASRDRLLRQISPAILEQSAGGLTKKHASRLKKWITAKIAAGASGPATPSGQMAEKNLLYFIETGPLPADVTTTAELEQTLLHFIRRSPGRLRQIFPEISRKTELAARLASQFSTQTLTELLEALSPGLAPELHRAIGSLQPALESVYPEKDFKTLLWSAALEFAWTDTAPQAGAFTEKILSRLTTELKLPETARPRQTETRPVEKEPHPAEPVKTPAVSPGTDEERLFRFLESGLLPPGGNNTAGLEDTLLILLRRSPGRLRQILPEISRKTELAARLASQFSTQTLIELLEALSPGLAPELQRAIGSLQPALESVYPENDFKTLLWSAALEFAWADTAPQAGVVEKAIISRLSARLDVPADVLLQQLAAFLPEKIRPVESLEMPDQLPEDDPGRPNTPVQAPETSPAGTDAEEQLFYFLEWSRLPRGLGAVPSEWEQIFADLLQKSPSRVRQRLLDINRKLNLAPRITRHFDLPVQREVLRALFPEQWPELQTVLSDLTQFLPAPGKEDARTGIWATALEWLLAHPPGLPDMPALVAFLVEKFAIRPGGPVPSGIRNRPSQIHNATWKYLQMTFSAITETELADLQTAITQWQTDEAGKFAPDSGARTAADRLVYRLTQGHTAWWDDTARSNEQLFEQLAGLPPAELRPALIQLWPAALRQQWLPALSPKTFERILAVFWGDYAGQATVYIDTFRSIAAEMQFSLNEADLRETFIEAALKPGLVARSGLLFQLALQKAAASAPWSDAQWTAAVEARAAAAIAGGDIRYYRVQELLREPNDLQPPEWTGVEIPPPPPIPAETPGQPAYPEILRGELQAVWQFLRHGIVPPAAGVPSAGAMEQLLLRLTDKHPALILRVLSDNLDQPGAVERLIRHFSPKAWRALAAVLWRPHFDNILDWWRELAGRLERAGPDSDPHRLERHFFTFLFQQANSLSSRAYEPSRLLDGLIRFIAGRENIPETLVRIQIKTAKPGAPPATLDALLDTPEQQQEQAATPPEPKRRRLWSDSPAPLPDEAIAVHNAGLVILAPYLGRFFGALNMLDGDVFKDENAADRGVHLLQYMATRQTQTPEHLLVLNKVLCGLPTGAPVSAGITLSAEEENLCNFLLNTVLQNWEIMKNSSVANLQGAFILRDGLLREGMDRWQLNVKKKAFDIVLDYLPWTISMVKLPWMEKRIEVEWKKKS